VEVIGLLTPVDLETTVFRRGFRGYQVQEVREFMTRLIQDYEHLYRENIELKEKLEHRETKLATYLRTEEMLHNALLLAQQTAEEVRQASQKQAELILREAEHRAEQVRARVKDEIRAELERLANLRQQAEFFRMQFKNFLASLAELADRQLNMEVTWQDLYRAGGPAEPRQDAAPGPGGQGQEVAEEA